MRRRAVLSGAHLRGFANASRPAALAVAIPSRVPRAFVARRCFRPTRSIQVHDVVRVARGLGARARGATRGRARPPGGGVPPRGASPRRGGARLGGARGRGRRPRAPAGVHPEPDRRRELRPRLRHHAPRRRAESRCDRARANRSSPPAPNPLRTFLAPPRRKRRPESIPLSRPLAATAATDRRPRPTEFTSRAPARRVSHRLERRVEAAVPSSPRSPPPPLRFPPALSFEHLPEPPPPRASVFRTANPVRRDVDLEGEARHRAQPGEARGGRHRGRFPDREPRRPGRGSQHRQVRRQRAVRRRLRPRDLRVIPREQEGHRRELGGRPARPPPPHPHLHRHEQDPHGGQAPQDPRRGGADRRRRGDVREVARVRRRRVLPEDAGRSDPKFLIASYPPSSRRARRR